MARERGEGGGLVGRHEAAVADDIGGEDGGKPACEMLLASTVGHNGRMLGKGNIELEWSFCPFVSIKPTVP